MGRRAMLLLRLQARHVHDRSPGAAVPAYDRGWRREARAAWWFGLGLGTVLVLADLARGSLDWPRGGCWAALAGTLVAVLRPARITAGDGWLAARGLLREHRVRTDLLTQVRRADGVAPRLVLRDVTGGRVEVDPRVLAANPLLWHRLDTGSSPWLLSVRTLPSASVRSWASKANTPELISR
ncbi:hypothetical protein ACWD4B_35635, partial [Streptomyces sp. NPDC002536]